MGCPRKTPSKQLLSGGGLQREGMGEKIGRSCHSQMFFKVDSLEDVAVLIN